MTDFSVAQQWEPVVTLLFFVIVISIISVVLLLFLGLA